MIMILILLPDDGWAGPPFSVFSLDMTYVLLIVACLVYGIYVMGETRHRSRKK